MNVSFIVENEVVLSADSAIYPQNGDLVRIETEGCNGEFYVVCREWSYRRILTATKERPVMTDDRVEVFLRKAAEHCPDDLIGATI